MSKVKGKMLFRSVKSSLGRFFAILAIMALGVGFFTGLMNAEPSMRLTGDKYFSQQNMFDLQLLSSYGLTEDDVTAFKEFSGVNGAEGGYSTDAAVMSGGKEIAYKFLSIPEEIAVPKLVYGNMPSEENQCLADAKVFTEKDIGETIKLVDAAGFKYSEFEICGIVQSPRYINVERGTTDIADGRITGFIYIDAAAFDSEAYHEILLDLDVEGAYFSEEYEKNVETASEPIKELLSERANDRYESIKTDAQNQLDSAREELDAAKAELEEARASLDQYWDLFNRYSDALTEEQREEYRKMLEDGEADYEQGLADYQTGEEAYQEGVSEIAAMREPLTYVLDLKSNQGYYNFSNDVGIVSGIATIFPAFFILIAALVCLTTMARMINEERTQIGTLKALGMSNGAIISKYLLYSGIASVAGCVGGYFIGTGVIPQIIWAVYNMMYGFASLEYYFSAIMFIAALAVVIVGAAAVTYFTCLRELKANPAELIRPKAPVAGKRTIFEKITFFWKRLSFLSKVTVRNTFRYKGRLAMMLIGIAGCTALLMTGFGLNDSIANITDYQYGEIHLYDATVRLDADYRDDVETILKNNAESYAFGYIEETHIYAGEWDKQVNAVALDKDSYPLFFDLHSGKTEIAYPESGEAVLSSKLADDLNVRVGDTVTVDMNGIKTELTVSGICDNYINHYVFVSPESVPEYAETAAFYTCEDDAAVKSTATELRGEEGISYVSVVSEEREVIDSSMLSMSYVVALIILCAGALAFIVLYNLTNINIMERVREVATVKVLGFNGRETGSYVLRENIILSVLGALIGLVAGIFLHMFVMSFVHVDMLAFDVRISVWSYLLSFAITVVFTLIVNFFMRFKLDKINMAESLKSVE